MTARAGGDGVLRLLTAAVLAPLLWAAIKLASPATFAAVALGVILIAAWEFYRMLAASPGPPFVGLGLLATAAVTLSFRLADRGTWLSATLVALLLAAVLGAMWRRDEPRSMLASIGQTILPVLLVGLTIGHVVALREVPDPIGADLVMLLFVCVVSGDTAAFYVGRAFGRHRLAPTISPKKSWEGVAGAIAGSIGGALIAHAWFYRALPIEHALALGALLGGAGVVGDLAESVVKRACGAKDSSGLLPGHGGVFDRVDNLIFAAPLLYQYYVLVLRGAS